MSLMQWCYNLLHIVGFILWEIIDLLEDT